MVDAIRLAALRSELAQRARTNLSIASRRGKLTEIAILPPASPTNAHTSSTVDHDKWNESYLKQLHNPASDLTERRKDLLERQKYLNKKQRELDAVNKYIIDNFLNKQNEAIKKFITSDKNFKIMKQKIAERDSLMTEFGYKETHFDSITKNHIYKNNLAALKAYIEAQNQTAGRKRKSKKRKSKSKKHKRTIKHK